MIESYIVDKYASIVFHVLKPSIEMDIGLLSPEHFHVNNYCVVLDILLVYYTKIKCVYVYTIGEEHILILRCS